MWIAIEDSLSNLKFSDNVEYGDDGNEDDTELGKLNKDGEPGWVVGTISKVVQTGKDRCRPKQLPVAELTPPWW